MPHYACILAEYDYVVIGAGPGGATAAKFLAEGDTSLRVCS